MKRLTIGLIMLAAVVLCSYEIASAPCCPPPPILTNPGRTLPKRRSSAPPRTYYTGAPTTLRTFYDPYSVYEETWVDWVNENSPYFLAQYEKIGDKAYVSTVSEKDVVKLLALLSYRGTFEKGVHRMAIEGIKVLGQKAEDTLIAIAQGKYALNGETTAKHLNRRNYEWLAVIALGMLEGERVKRELEKIALGPVAEPSGTFLMGKKEDILASLTKDGSREKKFWACISLGRSGDPACAGTLREVVESERDEYIRCAAAEGLSFIAGQKSIDGLRAVADPGKSNYHLRAYVSAAMGLVGSADPIRGITDVVDNAKDPDCRGAAGIAMAYLIRRRIDAGKDFRELADQYAEILWFEKDASAKRAMGLGLLLLNTPEGFESFKMFLSNPRDADLRCLSALAAGLTGSADAAAYLAALAPDADPTVEKARAYAMAMLCSADPRKLLDDLLSEENELLEGAGVFLSLRYNGDKSWRLVDDARYRKSTPFVQRALALSASAYCTTKGLVLAKQLLSGREQWGRADALVGLGMRGDVPALDMVTANVPPTNDEAYGCYSISMALMSSYALISGVQASGTDARMEVRLAASVGLGFLSHPDSLDGLIDLATKDANYKVRAYACAAIPLLNILPENEEKAIGMLLKVAADDKHYLPRAYAILSLSKFRESNAAFKAIMFGLGDKNTEVQAYSAISLGLYGNRSAAGALSKFIIANRGSGLSAAGYYGLAFVAGRADARDILREFEYTLRSDELQAMAFALGMSADVSIALDLTRFLENEDQILRDSTIKCFGMMRNLDLETRKAVVKALASYPAKLKAKNRDFKEDKFTRFYAAAARYALGDSSALAEAVDAMYSPDYYTELKIDMDWAALMRPVNDRIPEYRRLRPFFGLEDLPLQPNGGY